MATQFDSKSKDGTIETRLWLEEHDWLHALLKSEKNISPTFRIPDLISACVSMVFANPDASERVFDFLGAHLVLRPSHEPRRHVSMWMPQYDLLLQLQHSPANRHPHPNFQLDQLTTACVALGRQSDASGECVLRQARVNMASRFTRKKEAQLSS